MQASLRIEPPTNWEERARELAEQVDDLQRENTEQRDMIARLTEQLNESTPTLVRQLKQENEELKQGPIGEPEEDGPRG